MQAFQLPKSMLQSRRATGPTEGDSDPYIYKKGPAFGMPGVLVDGMDVMKVRCARLDAEWFILATRL